MQSHSSDAPAPALKRRSTLTLWLILAVCAAPLIGSYIAYYFWRPAAHVNYGELIEPHPLADAALRSLDGKTFHLSDLKGEWLLVSVDPGRCDDRCRLKLTYTRQVRLAQGKETERIERVWLVTDNETPAPALLAEHPGLHVVRAEESLVAKLFPAPASPANHIYVIDPLGNLMMRFPSNPDPRRILRDVSRLLRHSKWK